MIVDDHPLVIEGLAQAIAAEPGIELLGTATDGPDCLAWFGQHEADVAILDISLPGMDGIELCKRLKKVHPELKVIGLTTYDQASFITQMLRQGASGYLFKNADQAELVQAIQAVYQGDTYLAKAVNDKLIAKAMHGQGGSQGFIPKLSRREKEVLRLIMEEYTNQEIADELCIALTTVETHRVHLREKLGVRNTAGMVKQAIKFGLDRKSVV